LIDTADGQSGPGRNKTSSPPTVCPFDNDTVTENTVPNAPSSFPVAAPVPQQPQHLLKAQRLLQHWEEAQRLPQFLPCLIAPRSHQLHPRSESGPDSVGHHYSEFKCGHSFVRGGDPRFDLGQIDGLSTFPGSMPMIFIHFLSSSLGSRSWTTGSSGFGVSSRDRRSLELSPFTTGLPLM
jgi:hypothetical protein